MSDETSQPPITAEQIENEMLNVLEGDLSEEEAKELKFVLEEDKELVCYFLMRSALRRCIRIQLDADREHRQPRLPGRHPARRQKKFPRNHNRNQ